MGDLPVYDVVLLPPAEIDRRAIELSAGCSAVAGTEFVLNGDNAYPHISLFMATFEREKVPGVIGLLTDIAAATAELALEGDHFGRNEHGMFEVFYRRHAELVALQNTLVERLAPLRAGMRERDPVGRPLADYRLVAPEPARGNLARYGYDEIGELFKPHLTCARFRHREQPVPAALTADPAAFGGLFDRLALCVMGEHGTCTDLVAERRLVSRAPATP